MTHNDRRSRKRARQARRAEQRLRRQQRRDQCRQARQASQPQRPPDATPLRNFLLARLGEADGQLFGLFTTSLAAAQEACDRVESRGGEYLALVQPGPGRATGTGGRAIFLVSTVGACPEPDPCPDGYRVTRAKLVGLADLAAGTGRLLARASDRWLALLTAAFGFPPDDGPAWWYAGNGVAS
jgi:hypothetical protein